MQNKNKFRNGIKKNGLNILFLSFVDSGDTPKIVGLHFYISWFLDSIYNGNAKKVEECENGEWNITYCTYGFDNEKNLLKLFVVLGKM